MGSFSAQWEEKYRADTHLSIWPWSDLVSYVYRYARPSSPDFRVLELGPGAGANIPLFAHLGVRYHGVEGSPSMAAALRERFPQFRDTLAAGDFVEAIPFSGPFDLVVDRASITHNSTEAIRKCLANIQSLLAPGGVLLGIDWFSTVHDEFRNGREAEDANTRTDFKTGQFEGLGRVHFSDEAHLRDLLGGYRIDVLEHKTVVTRAPAPKNFGSWNFAARKGGA